MLTGVNGTPDLRADRHADAPASTAAAVMIPDHRAVVSSGQAPRDAATAACAWHQRPIILSVVVPKTHSIQRGASFLDGAG